MNVCGLLGFVACFLLALLEREKQSDERGARSPATVLLLQLLIVKLLTRTVSPVDYD